MYSFKYQKNIRKIKHVYLLNARRLHLVYFRNATCVRGFINASINSAKKLRNGINVVGTRAHVVPTSIRLTYHPHTNISRSQFLVYRSPQACCAVSFPKESSARL